MTAFIASTIFCFVIWLLLTFNGTFWGVDEIIAGIITAALVGMVTKKIFIKDFKLANPVRWLFLIAYLPRFFFEMAKANIDVAYRVVTKKIKPGIVKLSPGLQTDLASTILANSITLTPGTLSVDIDDRKNLYVHWINVNESILDKLPHECKPICSTFPLWARRIGE
jgi:multicomponent Na+:H+ antiporter subunit E